MEKRLAIIIRKILSGKASSKEVEEANLWYDSQHSEMHDIDQNKWSGIKTRMWRFIDGQILFERKKISHYKKQLQISISAAAIILITLSSYFLFYDTWHYHYMENSLADFSVSTGIGETKEVILPDSTHIWLNAKSTLYYNDNYGEKVRNVKLIGEAFFKVTRDEQHPFKVYTKQGITQVLGTSFNVRAYSSEYSQVGVLSGKVSVQLMEKNKKPVFVLLPGDEIKYNKQDQAVTTLHAENTDTFTYWKDNILNFDKMTLQEVADELERQYGVNITFKSKECTQLIFKGTFEQPQLDVILHTIGVTMNLNIINNNNQIIISCR